MFQILALASALLLSSVSTYAADDVIPTGKKKAAFEMSQYSEFINHELSRPKPACNLVDMGIPARRVEGQLVDHLGKPIRGVALAIVEPIGFSGHCYYDNFDITDELGRFVVGGAAGKTRLVFRMPEGQIWPVHLKPDDETIRVTWPKPARVVIRVTGDVAQPGVSVTIRTKNYWSGMEVLRHSKALNQDGVAVFENVIPGDYYATTNKTITVADKQTVRAIEVAQFSIAGDEELTVPCGENGVTEITGSYTTKPNPVAGNLGVYVSIERVKRDYVHNPPASELLKFDADGKFRSRPLAPGHYLVRYMVKGMGNGRFGPVGDSAMQTYRVQIDGTADTIDVNKIQQPSEAAKFVESLLQQAGGASSRRGDALAKQIKQSDVRGGAELMMLRILQDPNAPYQWRREIPGILQSLTDSPRVINGLLAVIQKPISQREMAQTLRAFQNSTVRINEVVTALTPLVNDENHITRGVTIRVLGELANKNREHATTIVPLLQRGLSDSSASTRNTAADYLGILEAKDALADLKNARDDVSGQVAVMSAFAAWKISGDPQDVYPTMKAILQRKGLLGKWEAAYFMKNVAEKHPVPEAMEPILRQVAKRAGKPPFRSSFEYEQSRAGKAAQQTLDLIESLRP